MFDKRWLRGKFCLKHIILVICFCFISVIGALLFSNEIFSQKELITFLDNKNYNYSVLLDKNVGENCYCYFDNLITFSSDKSLGTGLGGTVMMRTSSTYNDSDILLNVVDDLKPNQTVVSENIIKENNLNIGSKIYTKNKRDNSLLEFEIVNSIPFNYRIDSPTVNVERGLIILGFNSSLEESIQSNYMFFYKDDASKINNVGVMIVEGSLIAKSDQIASSKKIVLSDCIMCFALCFVPMLTFNIIILVFNISIYGFQRVQGNSNIYKTVLKDFGFYNVVLLIFVELIYLVTSLIFKITSPLLMLVILMSCEISFIVGAVATSTRLRRKY